MCWYCSSVKLTDFIYTPSDYENIVEYIKSLIEEQQFILADGNCELGHHKNNSGQWVDCHAANYSSYLLQFYRKLNSYIYFYIYFSVQCMTARFFRC